MTTLPRLIIIALLSLIVWAARAWAAQPLVVNPTLPQSAQVLAIRGQVEYRSSADAEWQPAGTGQVISAGYQVRTGDDSSAALYLEGGVILRLPPNSQFTLVEKLTPVGWLETINHLFARLLGHWPPLRLPGGVASVRD